MQYLIPQPAQQLALRCLRRANTIRVLSWRAPISARDPRASVQVFGAPMNIGEVLCNGRCVALRVRSRVTGTPHALREASPQHCSSNANTWHLTYLENCHEQADDRRPERHPGTRLPFHERRTRRLPGPAALLPGAEREDRHHHQLQRRTADWPDQ
ncbi:hypothetical protein PSAC2689_170050 [Paraburkholderia sacchari]